MGRDQEWERLAQIVELTRQSKSPITAVLLGTYGAGKTFLLWQLAKSLASAKTSGVLASGPMRLVDPEQKKDFTRSLVFRFFSRGIDIETQLVPLLTGVSAGKISAPAGLRPFVDLLLALARPEAASVARRVLTGGKASRKEAEGLGILEAAQIRTADDAISVLQALQVVLRAAGIAVLAILVDEVEYVDALPRGQKTSVLDSLKHLWDQEVDFFSKRADAAQLLMLLSATPNFWQHMKAQIRNEAGRGQTGVGVTPFFARIRQSDVIEMPADLAAKEARKLIVSRMTEMRPGQKKDDIIPFTDDYVDYVYQLSQGLPRQILEICGVVVHEAAQRKVKTIDAAQAKKILRDLLISYEPVSAKE